MIIRLVGVDPSLRNFGVVRGLYDTGTEEIRVENLELIKTNRHTDGGGDYMRRAIEVYHGFQQAVTGADLVLAEIPAGSQSSSAAWTLGIVVGVLASCPHPLVHVTSQDVKRAATGKKSASKQEVIEWARGLYPEANWLMYRGRLVNSNEHLADAVAVMHAGVKKKEFHQFVEALQNGGTKVG